tara:strand:+ start:2512 stop:3900 length:1389 start_codon:yes stop_codon:yes gene_type:complete
MACNTGNYFWSGVSFASAPQLYTDSNLTIVAPDGWYAIGGVYRQMSAGILGPQVPCPSCVVPCGGGLSIGGFSTGLFAIAFDMGTVPGAAVITFSAGVNNTTLRPIPDGLTWNYEGVASSEGSALVGGYQRGITGAQDGPPATFTVPCFDNNPGTPPITTATGSSGITPNGAQYYTWDASISNFVAAGAVTMGPYTGITNNVNGSQGVYPNIASLESTCLDWNCTALSSVNCWSGTALNVPPSPLDGVQPIAPNLASAVGTAWPSSNGEYRGWTTVIPSPPGILNSIATVMITAPCINTWWGIHVQCPRQLTSIESSTVSPLGTVFATVCAEALSTTIYHVPVDNAGNTNPNSSYFVGGAQFPASYDPATPGQYGQPDGVLGLHDFVYTDPNGVTPLPIGMYKVRFDPQDGSGLSNWVIEVGMLEYKDVVGGHALPPEGYPAPTQSSGTRQPGIVTSITKCP